MKLFAMLDKKAGMFGAPMIAVNEAHMGRFIQQQFEGTKETVAVYPEDFDLYYVGDWDQHTGKVGPLEQPAFLCNMTVILRKDG